ncbi:MAG: PilZ domain-containing protein [Turneriella sp.]
MPQNPASHEKRRHPRARVSLFADCSARLEKPTAAEGIIEDVSMGGLRMEIPGSEDPGAFVMHSRVAGEIASDNPAMQMAFSGEVVWRQQSMADQQPSLRLGIAFDPEVVLSEVLQSLQPQRQGGQP